MRHFEHISEYKRQEIFMKQPQSFTRYDKRETLAFALGAAIYMPALRKGCADDIIYKKHKSMMCTVICLEDAVGDLQREQAQASLIGILAEIDIALANGNANEQDIPMVFVRVRSPRQIAEISKAAGQRLRLLTGIVFPKFSSHNAQGYMEELENANSSCGASLYAMPVLEGEQIMGWDTRREELAAINKTIDSCRDRILNIRIGATDLCGLYGIRRGVDATVYDIQIIRDCISDIVNNFCRPQRDFVVSGPVWEYFCSGDRMLKPQLRETPFRHIYGETGVQKRCALIDRYIDGLIYEVLLDRANGLVGKTVIHPSHIAPVHALQTVTHEEYMDALSIIENSAGSVGVIKSSYSNKMNEIKPHSKWADKIMQRARIYGVLGEGHDFISLI